MWRAAGLIFLNEFRVLSRDHLALFMIFAAPVLIIAVAGFSLSDMFGAASDKRGYFIALIDQDHGSAAAAIIEELSGANNFTIVPERDLASARRFVLSNAQAPMALVIPSGASAALESGRSATIELFIDPIKRLEATAIELRLDELNRRSEGAARSRLRLQLADKTKRARAELQSTAVQLKALNDAIADYRRRVEIVRAGEERSLRVRIDRQIAGMREAAERSLDDARSVTNQQIKADLAQRRASIAALQNYLGELNRTKAEFEQWFASLKAAAGSHASEIPPPPNWPEMPTAAQIADLQQPPTISLPQPKLPTINTADLDLRGAALPPFPKVSFDTKLLSAPDVNIAVPAAIGWESHSISPRRLNVSAFDQYVPGFGITFLLIDMLWGMSVGLMDERQWGTLQRLRVSGASMPGMLIGRLAARSLIGFGQLIVLFVIGWLLFDISLGTNPAVLLVPGAAIAFAAAAFGLVIACVTSSRDSAIPIGSVAAMVMSAAGGCWWPLEFEPSWMRNIALAMPTTWTMRAFNNVMIRGLDAHSALWPSAIVVALGSVFLLAGIAGSPRLYR